MIWKETDMYRCNACDGEMKLISSKILRCQYCDKFYEKKNNDLAEITMEEVYKEALSLSQLNNENALNAAVNLYKELHHYKDSGSRLVQCQNRLLEMQIAYQREKEEQERKKIEFEQKEELRKRQQCEREKRKRIIKKVVILGAVILVASYLVVGFAQQKIAEHHESKYQMAVSLYDQGNYEEALKQFRKLKNYSDAQDYVLKINHQIEERDKIYNRALAFYNNGNVMNALSEFKKCSTYLDASEYINNLSVQVYEKAKDKYNMEDYSEAKRMLENIPENADAYKEAQTLLELVSADIQEQKTIETYDLALEYYNQGNYEQAQKLFVEINYKDSNEYLDRIGENIYQEAEALIETGNYEDGINKLELISETSEWSDCQRAVDLMNATIKKYRDMVYEEAKEIYKSTGNQDMSTYIDSMVGALLEQEDASTLKTEIINLYVPTKLTDCVELENELRSDIEYNVMDIYENEYEYGIKYNDTANEKYNEKQGFHYEDAYTSYYLNGKYVHFTATIVPFKTGGKDASFKIVADGNQLFSCNVNGTSKPQNIDLDITGVEEVKIVFFGGYQGHFLLADPYVYTNY